MEAGSTSSKSEFQKSTSNKADIFRSCSYWLAGSRPNDRRRHHLVLDWLALRLRQTHSAIVIGRIQPLFRNQEDENLD